MQITLPININNTVEVIICEVYVKCDIRLHPKHTPSTIEAKIAIEALQSKLTILSYELGQKIMQELEKNNQREK